MIELFRVFTSGPDLDGSLELHVELNANVFEGAPDENVRHVLKLSGKALLEMVDEIPVQRDDLPSDWPDPDARPTY